MGNVYIWVLGTIKTIHTFLFSLLTTLSIGQVNDLTGMWIAVLSRPIGDNWYSPLDGLILDINKKRVTVAHVFSDSIKTFPLSKKGDKIQIDKNYFGLIHSVSKDSLVVDFDNRMRTKFIPIKQYAVKIDSLNLTKNAWILKWSDGEYSVDLRIHFMNAKWYPEEYPNIAMIHRRAVNYKYQENERWALSHIMNEWFLTLTQGQFHPITYQISKVYKDSLKLKCLTWPIASEFRLLRSLNKEHSELTSIINHLIKKTWRVSEVLNHSNSFSEDTIALDEEYTAGHYSRDTILIKRSELFENRMSFKFNPDYTFQLILDNDIFWQTKWRITGDGKYIILNKGLHPYDYIELISWTDKELVIGKADDFGTNKKREYIPYYYELRLE